MYIYIYRIVQAIEYLFFSLLHPYKPVLLHNTSLYIHVPSPCIYRIVQATQQTNVGEMTSCKVGVKSRLKVVFFSTCLD